MNQVETTIAKAALGAGWPYGLAEECGRAAAWLAARGFDGVGAALDAIRPGPAAPRIDETPEAWVFQAAKAVRDGPSAFDLLSIGSKPERALLRDVDQPLLLIGFAGVAASAYDNAYRLAFPGGCEAVVDGSAATMAGGVPISGADVQIECRTERHDRAVVVATDIEIDDRLWHEAQDMAARSYVPSSESSRVFGAGAGLTDDD